MPTTSNAYRCTFSLSRTKQIFKITGGRFFSFDEISETAARRYSPSLLSELDTLQMVAEMWKAFGASE